MQYYINLLHLCKKMAQYWCTQTKVTFCLINTVKCINVRVGNIIILILTGVCWRWPSVGPVLYNIVCVLGVFILVACVALFLGGIRAGNTLHRRLLGNILTAPMEFFDVTPLGRILNRFSKEIETIDTQIVINFQNWFVTLLRVVTVPIVVAMGTPWFLVVMVPLILLYCVIQVSPTQLTVVLCVCVATLLFHFLVGELLLELFIVESFSSTTH